MGIKEKILEFMREEAYKPLDFEDLAEHMRLNAKDLGTLWPALNELEANADIVKTRYGKYGVPERMNLVVGRLSAHGRGYGFVIPDNPVEEGDVFIPPEAMMNAMHNDRVVARVNKKTADEKRSEGEVIRVLERANKTIVGTFENSRYFGFVVPDDKKVSGDIFIPKDEFNNAKPGQKVVAEIVKWPEKRRNAEGRVIEVIGDKDEPGTDILSIIKSYNLKEEFNEEVIS
jgi:ribonuclease R